MGNERDNRLQIDTAGDEPDLNPAEPNPNDEANPNQDAVKTKEDADKKAREDKERQERDRFTEHFYNMTYGAYEKWPKWRNVKKDELLVKDIKDIEDNPHEAMIRSRASYTNYNFNKLEPGDYTKEPNGSIVVRFDENRRAHALTNNSDPKSQKYKDGSRASMELIAGHDGIPVEIDLPDPHYGITEYENKGKTWQGNFSALHDTDAKRHFHYNINQLRSKLEAAEMALDKDGKKTNVIPITFSEKTNQFLQHLEKYKPELAKDFRDRQKKLMDEHLLRKIEFAHNDEIGLDKNAKMLNENEKVNDLIKKMVPTNTEDAMESEFLNKLYSEKDENGDIKKDENNKAIKLDTPAKKLDAISEEIDDIEKRLQTAKDMREELSEGYEKQDELMDLTSLRDAENKGKRVEAKDFENRLRLVGEIQKGNQSEKKIDARNNLLDAMDVETNDLKKRLDYLKKDLTLESGSLHAVNNDKKQKQLDNITKLEKGIEAEGKDRAKTRKNNEERQAPDFYKKSKEAMNKEIRVRSQADTDTKPKKP